jgi:XTP/dITP diphosphohydrolase
VRVLIGTTNPAKIREHRALLSDLPIELVTLEQIGTPPEVEETGRTFVENALIKARAYAAWSGLATLADDGGLTIDALNGEPGVRSKRWIDGRDSSDDELIAYTLERLRGLPVDQRGAAMKIAVALAVPPSRVRPSPAGGRGHEVVGEGEIRGYVPFEASPRRDPGFPFRSVFKVAGLDKYYIDLTPEEHERFNHRRQAVEPIRAYLSG